MVLFILTSLNILNYIDRNIFSALVPAIQRDLGFSDTQLGLIGSAFIFAYTLISPVFGFLGDRGGRSRVMAGGVVVWSVATAFTGSTISFVGQFFNRVTVGLGEAAYSVIAPTVIADHFPRVSRGKVFSLYSCAIPVGSALGYVIGGWLEPRVGWQRAFFVVGVPGLILAVLLFFMRDPKRGESDGLIGLSAQPAPAKETFKKLREGYRVLFGNGGFLSCVLGYAAYTFVVGGLAFWMPTYIVRYFPGVTAEKGNIVFGGVTVVGGFIGTAIGGWWADRMEHKSGNGYLKVSFYSMLLSVPLFFIVLHLSNFTQFVGVLFFMDIAVFLCTSPLDAAVINYVRPGLRATAMALNIFLIHALGDGVSRVLMGAVSDNRGLQYAISFLPWVLLFAGFLWLGGLIFYWTPMPWPQGALKFPRYQAHRGFRPDNSVQENTLQAFERARQAGAEMVECDVQLSRDGEVVIFHDKDLVRLAGSSEKVSELTAAELMRKAQAPTLRALLQDEKAVQMVNIELKTSEVFDGRLELAVAKVVSDCEAQGRVLFSSFNPLSLRRISKRLPNVPRALLVSEDRTDPGNKVYLRKMWLGALARPHLLHIDSAMAEPKRIERWIERGIPVAVWTVNDAKVAENLLNLGVRSVISDVLAEAQ
jgi:glycerophosphoryl diester phosphodiesterase/sugar phosphate permease